MYTCIHKGVLSTVVSSLEMLTMASACAICESGGGVWDDPVLIK